MSASTTVPPHVVIIEDNVTTNDLLHDWLKPHFTITSFLSGEAAVQTLTGSADLTVFVVDYNLPGMNGLELRQKLAPLYPAGKYILISGLFDEKLLQQAKDGGYDATLSKPFPMPTLFQKVQELFDLPEAKPNLVDIVKKS